MIVPFVDDSVLKKCENVVKVDCTPTLAKKWLSLSFGNRALSNANLTKLTRLILDGDWKSEVATIKFDNKGRLIDGHHRLTAIAHADKTVPVRVETDIDPELIDFIDTSCKPRSASNLIDIKNYREYGDKVKKSNACASIIRRILTYKKNIAVNNTNFSENFSREITDDKISDFYFKNKNLIDEIANKLDKNHRANIGCAFYIIAQKDLEHARKFFDIYTSTNWSEPRDKNISLLYKTITNNNYPKNTETRSNKIVKQVIKCYNAWAKDEPAKMQLVITNNDNFDVVDYAD